MMAKESCLKPRVPGGDALHYAYREPKNEQR